MDPHRSQQVFREDRVRVSVDPTQGEQQFLSARANLEQLRLAAYRADIADWLSDVFCTNIDPDNLLQELQSGTRLCQLAAAIEDGERCNPEAYEKFRRAMGDPAPRKYNERADAYFALDNISKFLTYVKSLGVKPAVMFEAADITKGNEKNVLYCLMELGRIQYGVVPPKMVEIERMLESGDYYSKMTEDDIYGLEHDIETLLKRLNKEHVEFRREGASKYEFDSVGTYSVAKVRGQIMVCHANHTWDTLEHLLISKDKGPNTKRTLRRRNSAVLDTAEATERRMSISDKQRQALEARRGSRMLSSSSVRSSTTTTTLESEETSSKEHDGLLKLENLALKAELDEARSSLQTMKTFEKQATIRIRELETELEEYGDERSQGDMEATKLVGENTRLKDQCTVLETTIQELRVQLRQQKDATTQQFERLKETYVTEAGETAAISTAKEAELRAEIERLKTQLIEQETMHEEARKQWNAKRAAFEERLRQQLAESRDKENQREAEHDEEIQDLESEIEDLSQKLHESTLQAAQLMKKEAGVKEQALLERIATLEGEANSCRDRMQEAQRDAQQAVRKLETMQADLTELQTSSSTASEKVKKRMAALESELDAARSEVIRVKGELSRSETRARESLNEAEHARRTLQAQLDDLVSRHEKDSSRVSSEAAERVAELEKLLKASQTKVSALQTENGELEASMRSLEGKLSAAQDDVHRLEEQASSASSLAQRHKHEAALAQSELAQRKEQVQGLSTRLEAAEAVASQAQKKLEAATADLEEAQSRTEALETKIRRMSSEGAQFQSSLDETEAAHKSQLAKLREMHGQELESLKSHHKARVEGFETEAERLRGVAQEFKEKALALEGEGSSKDIELQSQKRRIEVLQLQLEDQKRGSEEAKTVLRSQIDELQAQLRSSSEDASARADRLEASLYKRFDAEREQYLAQIEKLNQQLAEAYAEHDTVRKRVEGQAAEKLQSAEVQIKQLEELARIRKDTAEADMKELRVRCMGAERTVSTLQLEKDMLEQKVRQLTEQLSDVNQELDEANRKYLSELSKTRRDSSLNLRVDTSNGVFTDMNGTSLSDTEIQLICLNDTAARAANLEYLQARIAATEAQRKLAEVEQAYETNSTEAVLERVVDARRQHGAATDAVEEAYRKLNVAAQRALISLQRQEADAKLPRSAMDTEQRNKLLAAHAEAQQEIAQLSRDLRRVKHELDEGQVAQSSLSDDLNSAQSQSARQKEAYDKRVRDLLSQLEELQGKVDHCVATHHDPPAELSDEDKYKQAVMQWMANLLNEDFELDTFMDVLKDGKMLCRLANVVDEVEEQLRDYEDEHGPVAERIITADNVDITEDMRHRDLMEVQYIEDAIKGTPSATSNIRAFLQWTEGIGICFPPAFEVNDLVDDENHARVLQGIMQVAYRCRGLHVPAEIAEHRKSAKPTSVVPAPSTPRASYQHVSGDEIDEKVAEVVGFLPQMHTSIKRVGKGKYRLGNDRRLLLMRVLSNKVMVRVGGGWEDLKRYLTQHASRGRPQAAYKRQAQLAVDNVLLSTSGPGLCSTRTKVPRSESKHRPAQRSSSPVVAEVSPFKPGQQDMFM
eukprot:m.136707 g.136707  ORF g.136707 m.136707 type:complete len:1587 (-) comp14001_c0_seq9:5440-10200(-)